MSYKSLTRNYREFYDKASIIPQQDNQDELKLFTGLIRGMDKRTVLDLGCAEGRLAIQLATTGHAVTAADIAPSHLERTRRLAGEQGIKLETVECDIEDSIAPFNGKTYDVIYCMDVIEHLANPVRALENIRELLTDDGLLILHTPNFTDLFRFFRYFFRRKKLTDYYDPANLGDFHLHQYDYLSLEKTLNFIGFKIREVVPTRITLPLLSRLRIFGPLSRLLARWFPFFSDTLLVKAVRHEPIDVDRQIRYWRKQYAEGKLKP